MQASSENTRKLIVDTLAYYDLFDFPLTWEEIEKYLVQPGSFNKGSTFSSQSSRSNLEDQIKELIRDGLVIEDRGFYALAKREQIIPTRIRKTRIAQKKIKRARRVAGLMSLLPYIRGVFASGSLALENTGEESDLDFFVVTKSGRIWTARLLVTVLLSLLRIRRKAGQHVAPDKVCLNHYISDDALVITNQNIFTARIYAHLVPLYLDKSVLFDDFKRQNEWVLKFVYAWPTNSRCLIKGDVFLKICKQGQEVLFASPIGTKFENFARSYQKSRIERNPKTQDPHGRIEYTDQALQFHPDSIENSILEKYQRSVGI